MNKRQKKEKEDAKGENETSKGRGEEKERKGDQGILEDCKENNDETT